MCRDRYRGPHRELGRRDMKKRKTEASVLPGAEAQGTVAAHVCSPTPVSPAHMPGRGGRGFLCCTNAARVGKRDMCRQETWPAYPGATSLGLGPPSARIWFLRLSRGLGPGASRRCGLRRSSQESWRERGSPGCLRPRELAVRVLLGWERGAGWRGRCASTCRGGHPAEERGRV